LPRLQPRVGRKFPYSFLLFSFSFVFEASVCQSVSKLTNRFACAIRLPIMVAFNEPKLFLLVALLLAVLASSPAQYFTSAKSRQGLANLASTRRGEAAASQSWAELSGQVVHRCR